MYDELEKNENALICIFENTNKNIFTIVERDPEVFNTGVSIIKRILKDRHKFIGDIYSVQSYFGIKYIDDDNIKVDDKLYGADRNVLSLKELDEILEDESYLYIYVYDVQSNILLIKEDDKPIYHLDFNNLLEIEEFLEKIYK